MGDLTYTNSMMNEIRELLLNARQHVAVQVNTELLSTYWNVGRIIVEHEQENKERADYGKQTLKQLSKDLTKDFLFPISNLCGGFIKIIKFNRRCLLNCRGLIIANFLQSLMQISVVFTKRNQSIPDGRYVN